MKKFFFPVILSYFISFGALDALAQTSSCECSDSFETMVKVYEENYSLFKIKVNEENRKIYESFTELLSDEAKGITNIAECKNLMEKWLGFYRDEHNYIRYIGKQDRVFEKFTIDELEFKSENELKKQNHPLMGIWQSGVYRVAIVPVENEKFDYYGVILESQNEDWQKGEVKFKLGKVSGQATNFTAEFYMGDHSLSLRKASLKNAETIGFQGLSDWERVWPEPEISRKIEPSDFGKHHFKILEGDIPYFRFPNFWDEHAEWTDSVVKSNHDKLLASEFIIVDVRDNGGGSDMVYYPLLPYILSGTYKMGNPGYYLSDYNKSIILGWTGISLDNLEQEDEETQAFIKEVLETKDEFYFIGDQKYFDIDHDSIYSGPKKVAVLTDRNTVSSGETFVLRAKQSDRVVVYGQNTSGTVDGYNVIQFETPCFSFNFPSTIRAYDVGENPIDPYGIAPHVYLDEEEDVLNFAIRHMNVMLKKLND